MRRGLELSSWLGPRPSFSMTPEEVVGVVLVLVGLHWYRRSPGRKGSMSTSAVEHRRWMMDSPSFDLRSTAMERFPLPRRSSDGPLDFKCCEWHYLIVGFMQQ